MRNYWISWGFLNIIYWNSNYILIYTFGIKKLFKIEINFKGLMETCVGLGLSVGPALGGLLFSVSDQKFRCCILIYYKRFLER